MLAKTKAKLDTFYDGVPQLGTDGQLHDLHRGTKISVQQGEILAAFHRELKPDLSIEVGLAYGFSAAFILDAMSELSYGRHIAIDPFQQNSWHGIGVKLVDDLGFGDRFEWREEFSSYTLSRMHHEGQRAQFVFIDGNHTFDACLIDFMLADQVLDVGGMIIIDDMWMPSIRKVVGFIKNNLGHYAEVKTVFDNVYCVRKLAADTRTWDHFRNFGVVQRPSKQWYEKAFHFVKRT